MVGGSAPSELERRVSAPKHTPTSTALLWTMHRSECMVAWFVYKFILCWVSEPCIGVDACLHDLYIKWCIINPCFNKPKLVCFLYCTFHAPCLLHRRLSYTKWYTEREFLNMWMLEVHFLNIKWSLNIFLCNDLWQNFNKKFWIAETTLLNSWNNPFDKVVLLF